MLEKSTKLLCHELQKSVNVAIASNFGLAEALETVLVDEINFLYPTIIQNALKLLQLLVMTDDGLTKVIKSEPTMKKLLQLTAFEHFEKFSALAADVLVVISAVPAGEKNFRHSECFQQFSLAAVDEFLSQGGFFLQAVQNILKSLPTNKSTVEFLANVVARKPEVFAEAGIFEALSEFMLDDDRLFGALKLLAIITSCKKGVDLAANLEILFASVVTSKDLPDCCLTDAIVAFKHCLMHQESLNMPKILWSSLIEVLIAKTYTKCNNFLQQAAIQALRAMSDKPDVKKELCRVYKVKIREIPCLSPESRVLLDDLVQWLDYRNYKPNKPSKYSKLFI